MSAHGVAPADDLPRTETLHFYDPGGDEGRMEFRLIYKGSLPAQGSGGNRTREKHTIRKQLHLQLRELWQQQPHLRSLTTRRFRVELDEAGHRQVWPSLDEKDKTWLDHVADDYKRCGGRFVPLIRQQGGLAVLTCSLDILFLRRERPGRLISADGDIDNRIKVLFDGLKMPTNVPDLGGLPLEQDEDPFFCLLEDDSLVTSISVTTDRLLLPLAGVAGEKPSDVQLIIHVTVQTPLEPFTGRTLV